MEIDRMHMELNGIKRKKLKPQNQIQKNTLASSILFVCI